MSASDFDVIRAYLEAHAQNSSDYGLDGYQPPEALATLARIEADYAQRHDLRVESLGLIRAERLALAERVREACAKSVDVDREGCSCDLCEVCRGEAQGIRELDLAPLLESLTSE